MSNDKSVIINELERKLLEFKDQPGFLLGLDGWTLRSVPIEQRSRFLAAYERALQIAHHPDLFVKPEEKERHQKYLQAVSNAISFMNSDVFAYELATEDVPTKQNHFIRLQDRLAKKEQEMRMVEEQLALKDSNYQTLLIERAKIEKDVTRLEAEALLANPMCRLKAYQDWQLRSAKTYPIAHMGKVLVRGVKMKSIFEGKEFNEMIPEEEEDFAMLDIRFSKRIKKQYLTKEQMLLKLENGTHEYRNYKARVIGGMPAIAVREFVNYNNAKAVKALGETLASLISSSSKLTFSSRAEVQADKSYETRITPFTTPYFTENIPVLIKFEQVQEGGWAKYDLVYVDSITDRNKK